MVRCVPQVSQKARVTAFSLSGCVNVFGSPFIQRKPATGISMNMLGAPPVMCWHARQWHCARRIGSPSET